jgi:hypothetical protein
MRSFLNSTLRQSVGGVLRKHFGDISRLDDHEVVRLANMLADRSWVLEFSDMETLETFCGKMWAHNPRNKDRTLAMFMRGVDTHDFSTKRDQGVLYSGIYFLSNHYKTRLGMFLEDTKSEDELKKVADIKKFADKEVKMRDYAAAYALIKRKKVIEDTPGGKWLKSNEEKLNILGDNAKNSVWSYASKKFVDGMSGEVDVFLAFPAFKSTNRSLEGHVLFRNPLVTKIVYHLEHGTNPNVSLPPEAFKGGIRTNKTPEGKPRTIVAKGKEVVFKVARDL